MNHLAEMMFWAALAGMFLGGVLVSVFCHMG
jgi:hypothetical protein